MAPSRKPSRTAKNYVENFGRVRVERHRGGYRVRRFDRAKKTTVDIAFFMDEAAAIARAREVAHADAVAGPVRADSATIALLGEKVLDPNLNMAWSPNTRKNWESLFRQHIANVDPAKMHPNGAKPLGNRLARDITASELGQFIRDKALKEKLSRSMLSKLIQFLHKVEKQAVAAGIWNAAENPTTGLAIPDGSSGKAPGIQRIRDADIPTAAQVKALRAALAEVDTKYAVMCDIAAHCGLRLGELLALKHEDISIKNRTITVERQLREEPKSPPVLAEPKTRAGFRVVTIPKGIMPALRAYHRKLKTGDYLFTDSKGDFILRANFNQVLNGRISGGVRTSKGAYDVAKWPKRFTWHTLRHYAITMWIKSGVNVVDASEMAGHASPVTTMKLYVGSDRDAAVRAAKIL